jgi:hypothetical protein
MYMFDWYKMLIDIKLLTPRILCVILPNFAVLDIVGKINFSKNKNMQI